MWANGAALATILLLTATLIVVVLVNGIGAFWPAAVVEVQLAGGGRLLGESITADVNPDNGVRSRQFKTGNRELDRERQDYHWLPEKTIQSIDYPAGAYTVERMQNGNFYGYLDHLELPSLEVPEGDNDQRLQAALAEAREARRRTMGPIESRIAVLNERLEALRDGIAKAQYARDRVGPAGPHAEEALHGIEDQAGESP